MYKAWIKGSGAGYPWCLKEGGAYVRTESTDHWRTSEKRKTDHRTEKDPFRCHTGRKLVQLKGDLLHG